MTAVARVAPAVVKGSAIPKCVLSQPPTAAVGVETDEQKIADRHRRQHERQMHEGIEGEGARKTAPGEQVSHQHGERQAVSDAAQGDLETEAQGVELGGTQCGHDGFP